MNYPFVVVPSPGLYGDGKVRVYSRHRSREMAVRVAEQVTARHQRGMEPHGGSGGAYYAAEWGLDRLWFWADSPPVPVQSKGGGA